MGGLDEWLPPAHLALRHVAGTETGLQIAQACIYPGFALEITVETSTARSCLKQVDGLVGPSAGLLVAG